MSSKTTLVTGIWDLGRESMGDGWSRSFDHYLSHFDKLLSELKYIYLIIFSDSTIDDFIWERRNIWLGPLISMEKLLIPLLS